MVVCEENLGRVAITEYQIIKTFDFKKITISFTNVNFIQEEHTK